METIDSIEPEVREMARKKKLAVWKDSLGLLHIGPSLDEPRIASVWRDEFIGRFTIFTSRALGARIVTCLPREMCLDEIQAIVKAA